MMFVLLVKISEHDIYRQTAVRRDEQRGMSTLLATYTLIFVQDQKFLLLLHDFSKAFVACRNKGPRLLFLFFISS